MISKPAIVRPDAPVGVGTVGTFGVGGGEHKGQIVRTSAGTGSACG